jgi:molecular chaperone GrpE
MEPDPNGAIDAILNDFRNWLTALPTPVGMPVEVPTEAAARAVPPGIDLATVVGQFTALRHEVNLQTKSSRTSLDQNAETLKKLGEALDQLKKPAGPTPDQILKPVLKGITDVYDNLSLALKQVVRQRETILDLFHELDDVEPIPDLPDLPEEPATPEPVAPPAPSGFWRRFAGAKPVPRGESPSAGARKILDDWRTKVLADREARAEEVAGAIDRFTKTLDGLLAGYEMSMNRIDRILEQYEVEPIPAEGELFDPELMEVIEVVSDPEFADGHVAEEVRRGYYWRGNVFRYSQVKVARSTSSE